MERGRRPGGGEGAALTPSDPTRPQGVHRLAKYYQNLPPQTRGMVLMFLGGIAFATMHATFRYAASDQHPFEVTFFRNFLALLVMGPILLRHGFSVFRTQRLPLHLLRGVIHVTAMLIFFSAVPITPLSTIAAMSFTAPLFVTIGAVIFLGEVVRARRITALGLGLIGTLIIVRPGFIEVELGPMLVLTSAAIWGGAMVVIKLLSRTESSFTLTAYMMVILTPVSLVPALFVWQWPTLAELGWFAGLGIFGTVGHLCLAQAFREADTSAVMPVDFLRLLWSSMFGFLLFAEVPDIWVFVGAVVIFSSTVYLAYREAKIARQTTRSATGPPS